MNEDLLEDLKNLTSALEKSSEELNIKINNKEALLDEKLKKISDVLEQAEKEENELRYMISNLEKTLSFFNSKIEETGKIIEEVSLKATSIKLDVKKIEQKMDNFKNLQTDAENAQKAIEDFNKDTSKIHSDIINLSEEASVCDDAYKTIKENFDKMNKEVSKFVSSDLGKLTIKDDATVKRDFAQYVKNHLVAEGTFSDSNLIWKK